MNPRDEVRARIRGLYGLADADASGGDPERLGAALLAGGCRLVQLRCKGWARDDIAAAARALRDRCRAVGATFVLNDDAALAAEVDADGAHLGQRDLDAAAARALLGPHRILGRSTNALAQVADALTGADYLAFGPVWTTPHLSHPKPVQGLDTLAAARALVPSGVPLVAIGGITAARLAGVRAAGADAWAVIGAVAGALDPIAATRALVYADDA